jgi:hypothetical protein
MMIEFMGLVFTTRGELADKYQKSFAYGQDSQAEQLKALREQVASAHAQGFSTASGGAGEFGMTSDGVQTFTPQEEGSYKLTTRATDKDDGYLKGFTRDSSAFVVDNEAGTIHEVPANVPRYGKLLPGSRKPHGNT